MRRFEDYHAPPATKADVRAWGRAVPWWVPRIGLIGLGVAGVVAGFVGDDTGRCSTTDPTVCGPDAVFSVFFGFLCLTALLLWFVPRLGCLVGSVVGVVDVVLDDVLESRVVFGGFAIACLAVFVAMRAGDRRSRRGLTERAGPRPVRCPQGLAVPGWSPLLALAGALAVLGVGGFVWCDHLQKVEQEHLARAQETSATVSKVDEDGYAVQVRLPEGGTRPVDTLDYYDQGDELPVLVDPADRTWARPVAEPYDPTYWLTGAVLALGLAGVLAWRQLTLRRWRHLAPDRDLPAVAVRVDVDPELDSALLFAADATTADRPFAELGTYPAPWPGSPETYDDAELQELGEAWRSATPEAPSTLSEGILLGDLGPGGLAMVLLPEGILWPTSGLRVGRDPAPLSGGTKDGDHSSHGPAGWWQRWHGGTDDSPTSDDESGFPGRPAEASTGLLPRLPHEWRPSDREIALGRLKAAAWGLLPLAVVAGYTYFDFDLLFAFGAIAIGTSNATAIWSNTRSRLLADEDALTVSGTLFEHRVPWAVLHGVRVEDGDIIVAWQPEELLEFGPLEDPDAVAGTIEALRQERAELVRHHAAVSQRLRLDWLPVPALGLLCALVVLVLSRTLA